MTLIHTRKCPIGVLAYSESHIYMVQGIAEVNY